MLESELPTAALFSKRKKQILFPIFALFILLTAFGSYFLYQRLYKPQFSSYDPNLPEFAAYVEDADWYGFSCTIVELIEKKINYGSLYSLTVAKCEYTRPDETDDYVWIPLAVINPQTDQLMIYGGNPNDNASVLTHYFVTEALRRVWQVEVGSKISVGFNLSTDKNSLIPSQPFVAAAINSNYKENTFRDFALTGDSNVLQKGKSLLPIGINY